MSNKMPRCPGGQADRGDISWRADLRHGGHHLPTGDQDGDQHGDESEC